MNEQKMTLEELAVLAKTAGMNPSPTQLQYLYDEASELLPRLMRLHDAPVRDDVQPDSARPPALPT